jgi:hypothetical protein
MKAGTVEQEEAIFARQWHNKHISTATHTDATRKDTLFSMQTNWTSQESVA